ncbi:hypothetical protein VB264_17250 [Arcicella aquatica]|uniref:Uncharacterized protein n=1 Tax=Arcicella aquatica TaxID=217141 RepID=A0ABU5QRA7_9BACT|nr:hypothetical protein [Arcicella aquatica]MEA5259548.1 hypothetical protein [Arcicella aquatica]
MQAQLSFKDSVITEKQKTVVAFLEANNPDILDYYSKADLETLINQRIQHYYSELERLTLLGFQSAEAEEIANKQLFDFKTSYSRLHDMLVEQYAFSIDVFDAETSAKILYFSKEYRSLIDEGRSITTLIESFFMD